MKKKIDIYSVLIILLWLISFLFISYSFKLNFLKDVKTIIFLNSLVNITFFISYMNYAREKSSGLLFFQSNEIFDKSDQKLLYLKQLLALGLILLNTYSVASFKYAWLVEYIAIYYAILFLFWFVPALFLLIYKPKSKGMDV
jgi:hypothetical protein